MKIVITAVMMCPEIEEESEFTFIFRRFQKRNDSNLVQRRERAGVGFWEGHSRHRVWRLQNVGMEGGGQVCLHHVVSNI